jgi:ribonuclease HII
MPAVAVIGGDDRVASISAASIVAKVIRDREMDRAAAHYPNYGFEKHKGYATAAHLEAIERFGPSPLHRRSFAPVRETPPAAAAMFGER